MADLSDFLVDYVATSQFTDSNIPILQAYELAKETIIVQTKELDEWRKYGKDADDLIKKYETDVSELNSNITEYKSELESILYVLSGGENNHFEGIYDAINQISSLHDIKTEYEKMSPLFYELKEKNKTLNEELEKCKSDEAYSQKPAIVNEINRLNRDINDINIENKKLLGQLESKNSQIAELEQNESDLKLKFGSYKNKKYNEIVKQNVAIRNLQAGYKRMEEDAKNYQGQLELNQFNKGYYEAQLKTLEDNYTKLKSDNELANTEIKTLRQTSEDSSKLYGKIKKENENLLEINRKLEAQVNSITDASNFNARIYTKNNTELGNENNKLKEQIKTLEEEVELKRQQVGKLTEELKMQRENSSSDKHDVNMGKVYKSLNEQMNKDMETLKKSNKALDEKNAELTKANAELSEKRGELSKLYDNIKNELELTKAALEESNAKNTTIISEMKEQCDKNNEEMKSTLSKSLELLRKCNRVAKSYLEEYNSSKEHWIQVNKFDDSAKLGNIELTIDSLSSDQNVKRYNRSVRVTEAVDKFTNLKATNTSI
jgi:chromosome segregation ATPase